MFCFTRAAGAPRPLHARPVLTRTTPRFARCGPFGPAAGPPGPLRALRVRRATVIVQNRPWGGWTCPPRNNKVMLPRGENREAVGLIFIISKGEAKIRWCLTLATGRYLRYPCGSFCSQGDGVARWGSRVALWWPAGAAGGGQFLKNKKSKCQKWPLQRPFLAF